MNYRICRPALGPIWAVGTACLTGKFGIASYPQRDRGGPRYILNFSFYSTSQQAIEKSVWITVYPHLLGALAHLLGALSALIGGVMAPVSYTHLTLPTNREV